MGKTKLGLFGSCQLYVGSIAFFNEIVKTDNNIIILFNLLFYEYDKKYCGPNLQKTLDYKIFDEIDILIIENNNLTNIASSKKIIEYCLNKNIKIIKTCLIKFPIFPINWPGYGENQSDYNNWKGLNNIDYKQKFNILINKLHKSFAKTDLNITIVEFIEHNFNKMLLFTHSLHPTNVLLHELFKSIFDNLKIDINRYKFNHEIDLLSLYWINPFTTKMVSDLNIIFEPITDDTFYIEKYKKYIDNITNNAVDEYISKLDYKFLYTFFENEIITDLMPQNSASKVVHCNFNITQQVPNSEIVTLDDNIIYLVIHNTYSKHFWHDNLEIVLHAQIYLNYFKNTQFMNKYKFKIIAKPKVIFNKNNNIVYDFINNDIVFIDDDKSYKGNFLFIKAGVVEFPNNKINLSIYDDLIIKANEKYLGRMSYHDKLWISRRNLDIKTYWHKRFITNINDIAETILNHGFHEVFFPCNDILYQVYLVNNASTIFSEVGTSMINIFYMKKGSVFITDADPFTVCNNFSITNIALLKDIKKISYDKDKTCSDIECMQLYNLSLPKDFNFPYKFIDTNDFKLWFNSILNNIHNIIMKTKIPFLDLSRELISIKDELKTKMDTIIFEKTDFILGKDLEIFEQNFAKYISVDYCVGVANGTDAIEMAVQSLGLNCDDEIITQSNTYVATCFGVTSNNIKLKLVDIDEDTYQMNLDELEKKITEKTKVIIIVHLTGSCCDMERLMKIVEKHNLILFEDCAQSHGAYFKNKRLGSFGLLSTHSFYPGKNLGAFGDGGAICTNNYGFYEKLQKIRNNGSIEKYKHEIMGRNSRLDTLQAAVLDIKLKHLDNNNSKRRKNAQLYHNLLKNIKEIQLPKIVEGCMPVYHLFIVRAYKRDELKKHLEKNNVSVGIHYPICISNLKCYENYFEEKYEHAEKNSENILSLPMFPDLSEEEIKMICNLIIDFYIIDFPF